MRDGAPADGPTNVVRGYVPLRAETTGRLLTPSGGGQLLCFPEYGSLNSNNDLGAMATRRHGRSKEPAVRGQRLIWGDSGGAAGGCSTVRAPGPRVSF